MIKLFNVVDKTAAGLTIRVDRKIIPHNDYAVYVIYDTDVVDTQHQDYYTWRCITRDVPNTVPNYELFVDIVLDNSALYPAFSEIVADYTTLANSLLKIVSLQELEILETLKSRVDLVRRRLPNPGTFINDTDGIGDGGVVAYAGGFYKKFSIDEYLQFINGTLIEVNIVAPATKFWWDFSHKDADLNPNPYSHYRGVPFQLTDLLVQGSTIRALYAWGLLEVDLGFQTSDSGLTISFQRSPQIASWIQTFIAEYEKQKRITKMDFVNSYGVAVGTSPYFIAGLYGKMVGMTAINGNIALNTLLGFNSGSNRPM